MFQAGKTRKEHETRESREEAQDGSGGRDEEELLQGERFGNKIKLGEALGLAGLSKSTYEYDRRRLGKKEDPDEQRIMLEIKAVWLRSKKRYGYRKIAIALKNRYGETVNHKKVLRLRKERDVCAVLSGHGKPYSSYRGTVGKVAPNILKRDFHARACLEKAGTDVTERKFCFGKVYFSPVIDFFNDQILAYSLYGKYPDTAGRILHSDQGWQYQRPAYRSSLKKHGIVQSRSRKGNCLDNAKTENLFSKLKKEMYYGHEKDFRSYAEVSKAIDEYVQWYNEERIVTRLRAAPVSHRSYAPSVTGMSYI